MAKYSKKAQKKVGTVMREYKQGVLKSGKKGKGGKVKSRKQAIAIALNEAREAGTKVPPKKSGKAKSSSKKAAVSTKTKVKKAKTKK